MTSRFMHSALLGFLAALATHGAHAAPALNILYDFGVVRNGNTPQAAPTAGPNGVYYGTTNSGGATGNGTVFELIPDASSATGWKQRIIYAFSGKDGSIPASGLLVSKDGALFGLTSSGGATGSGVAFELVPPVPGETEWTETVLHSFNGTSDGSAPYGTLAAGADGVLYGSTATGGTGQGGAVFSLTPPATAGGTWTETVLYSFTFGPDGISPTGGVFYDAATGTITGMTSGGGLNNEGQVYQLSPPAVAGSPWAKIDLYDFRGISDGNFPLGGLVRDGSGVFYGVTDAGGLSGWGTVFSLAPPQGSRKYWLETVLYHFTGRLDGGSPTSTPSLAPDGTLYGVTQAGGNLGEGTAFSLVPPAKGRDWTETALASFDGVNGVNPGGVTLEANGGLIGSTIYGGTLGNGGTIFQLTPTQLSGGTVWTQTTLVDFQMPSTDAVYPDASLLLGKGGVLYGSANSGGAANDGAVYALAPPAAGAAEWQRTILHSFDGTDGSGPTGKLLAGPGGVLYGVTTSGGPNSATPYGVVYALIPPGAGKTTWTEQVLHAFTGVASADGAFPAAGLIADASGALYGTTGSGGSASSDDSFGNGIVYKLTPPPAGRTGWKETILYSFTGPDGSTPQGSLLFDGAGALYGTTYTGGATGEGSVFKLIPPVAGSNVWSETLLHSFDVSVGNDGAIPGTEQLVMDAAGKLYGTASQGGANFDGVVFELSPPTGSATSWTETILHSFTGADGTGPFTGLAINGKGALFGVTPQGGAYQYYGTIFKLVPPATPGAAPKFAVLHSFNPAYGLDGAYPAGALIKDGKGNLYGTAQGGGYGNSGIAFEIAQ